MNRILQVFCILLSAATLTLGIPNELYNLGSPFFGFIALIPLYLVFNTCKSYKEFAVLFGLHAGLIHLASSYWLSYFKDFAALTLGASAAGTALIAFLCGLFFMVPFMKYQGPDSDKARFFSNPNYFTALKIFWFAISYTIYEWVKSTGFLAYPWGTLYQTTWHFRIFIQIADITGVYGITFLIAAFSAIIAEGINLFYSVKNTESDFKKAENFIRSATVVLALFSVTFIYGSCQYFKIRKPSKFINTIMVQQNADPWSLDTDDKTILTSQRLTKEKLDQAKSRNESVDLIIWSEGCLKYRFPRAEFHYKRYPKEKPLISFIKETKTPFLLGGSYAREGTSKRFNGALLFDSEGNFRGAYPKNHLVPLAEAVPFTDIKPVAEFFKKVIGISAGWTPGDKYTMFNIPCRYPEERQAEVTNVISLSQNFNQSKTPEKPYVKFSTPICFDDAFPDVCRPLANYGSELFLNITDDSWSMTKSSEYQHFVVASFRAIELRTTLARSTNSGYSVVVDPAGKIIMDMPLFEEASEFVKIPVYPATNTIYQRFGNWLPVSLFILCLSVILFEYLHIDAPLFVKSERKKFNKNKKLKKKKK